MERYFNGEFLKEDVVLPITNEISFLRGYAIFDFFGIRGGVPLFVDDYLDRFYNSADQVGLKVSISKSTLLSDIHKLISRNELRKAYFKMILTGGYSADGFRTKSSNLYILPKHLEEHPEIKYTQGVKLILDAYKREHPTVKSTNYMNANMRIPEMDKAGAEEVLYHDNGFVRECSRCNFFMVKGKTLITPSEEILKGITRKQILHLAKEDYKVEERNVALTELKEADEVFITSTTKMLFPVVQIDEQIIGDGSVGTATKDLLDKMKAHTVAYILEKA